jgi:predicted DNA-binding transcriptional regulator AlpA
MAIKPNRPVHRASFRAIEAASLVQPTLAVKSDDRRGAFNQSELFTTPEAAAYAKLAVPTLERFRLTGDGPMFAKLGGSVRYRRCDLDAWIESRLVRSTSQNP